MNRIEKAIKYINIDGVGLELGPSYNPILKKSSGVNIKTVDHTTKEELIKKYSCMPKEKIDSIEDVDYIWTGGTLTELIGKENYFDYIIASHFIEHSPDMISFLQDCEKLLKPGGVLSLVVPDKRYCFDRFKPLSSIGAVVDAHLDPLKFHSPGSVLDHLCCSVFMEGDVLLWNDFIMDKAIIKYQDLSELKLMVELANKQTGYIDVHHWIFTPSSFSLIIQDLADLGFHSLTEVGSFYTEECEFFISLCKSDKHVSRKDRLEILKRIEAELFYVYTEKTYTISGVKNIIRKIKNILIHIFTSR